MIERFRRDHRSTQLVLMLVLTFSTGIVDAIGYLGLDRVFTANMTGNVVILGMALAGADDLPIVGPAVAFAGFFAGAVVAGRLLRALPIGWTSQTTVIFLAVGVVIAAAGIAIGLIPGQRPIELAVTAALGLAMGAQAAAARHLSVKDVTTVVVTSTLTGLAADSWLAARTEAHPWRRRVAAIILVGLGALVGALSLRIHVSFGLLVAAAVIVASAVVGHLSRPTGNREDSAVH